MGDVQSARYWEQESKDLGAEFQWGGIDSTGLARIIANENIFTKDSKFLIAGAGMSLDGVALRNELGIDGSNIYAPDFSETSVEYQRSLGISSGVEDLLIRNPDLVRKFDVVMDGAMTDVFTSNWNPSDTNMSTMKKVLSTKSKILLVNLLSYLKPGGLFIVKSMVANKEEYTGYVRVATGLDYGDVDEYDSSELKKHKDVTYDTNRYGRRIPEGFGIDGHLGLWYPFDDPTNAEKIARGALKSRKTMVSSPKRVASPKKSAIQRAPTQQAISKTRRPRNTKKN